MNFVPVVVSFSYLFHSFYKYSTFLLFIAILELFIPRQTLRHRHRRHRTVAAAVPFFFPACRSPFYLIVFFLFRYSLRLYSCWNARSREGFCVCDRQYKQNTHAYNTSQVRSLLLLQVASLHVPTCLATSLLTAFIKFACFNSSLSFFSLLLFILFGCTFFSVSPSPWAFTVLLGLFYFINSY